LEGGGIAKFNNLCVAEAFSNRETSAAEKYVAPGGRGLPVDEVERCMPAEKI